MINKSGRLRGFLAPNLSGTHFLSIAFLCATGFIKGALKIWKVNSTLATLSSCVFIRQISVRISISGTDSTSSVASYTAADF